MTAELIALVVAAFIQFLHIGVSGYFMNATPEGRAWNQSPRDIPRDPGLKGGRAQRAAENHVTALLLFATAVLTLAVTDQFTGWTAVLAWVFVLARLLYIPAYVQGWSPARSGIWAVGALATALLLLAALF
ncbi:MAPEG family protein [Rubellimicrobium aerolatum]|uniref:MAPEG family protein n=1 Tax=Rubellimicrobium aerolatum TaxID=490979 RepID=A0ABW0SB22_9RHOB|nr:MAPEG family protein [Rubellimicrobium aerolatum]MBP1805346.1 putative MAPEG superfamily protein [Rubellimicrobium aerolatum]